MSIPNEKDIMNDLLVLLCNSPDGTLRPQEAYSKLSECYPQLTLEEKKGKYKNSISKFANTVQFARELAAKYGFIYRPDDSDSPGRGYWKITEPGRRYVASILRRQ